MNGDPNLPNYGHPGYFHPSHGISPSKAGAMLVGAARKMHPGKSGKGAPRKFSGRGLVRSAGSLFHPGGGKK